MMPITIDEIHSEIKKHIVAHPKMWTRMELEYGASLIKPNDMITKTYYIQEGIFKAQAHGKWSGLDIIVNLFAEHNPCIPLVQFENKIATFSAIAIGKTNIVYAIDIAKIHKLHKDYPILSEALKFIGNRVYEHEFLIKDLVQCKPFHNQFKHSFEEFPCLARMQPEDVVDFFGVDPKTIQREILANAKRPQWMASISDVIAQKIEEIYRKNNQTLAKN